MNKVILRVKEWHKKNVKLENTTNAIKNRDISKYFHVSCKITLRSDYNSED